MNVAVRFGTIAALLFAAGCAGATSGIPTALPAGFGPAMDATGKPVTASIAILIPKVNPQLDPRFIVTQTKSARITAYVHGHDKNAIATTLADLASRSKICKKDATGRHCTVVVDLPHGGSYDFLVQTFNRIPKHGKIPPAAKQLAAGIATRKLEKNAKVGVVLGGVVAQTSLSLTVATGPVIDPLSESVTIEASDADGNAIVTDEYVDSKGHAVTITPAADAAAAGTVTFTPPSFTAPTAAVTLAYAPIGMTVTQATNGFATTLSATASNAAAAGTATLTLNKPVMVINAIPSGNSAGLAGIAMGPDGRLWFTENCDAKIGAVDSSWNFSAYDTTTPGIGPGSIAAGPDGNMWFTSTVKNTVVRMTTAGVVTGSWPTTTANSFPKGINTGPDGNLWFAEQGANQIARVTTSGTITEYTLPGSNTQPGDVIAGQAGNLWFDECGGAIGSMTTTGTPTIYPVAGNTHPASLVQAADGTVWFSQCEQEIGRMTTSGVVTQYPLPAPYEATGVTVGPDGAIWFGMVAPSGYAHKIGRITPGGAVVTYTLPGTNPYPSFITVDKTGAIWFGEYNGNAIGRMQ